MLRRNRSLPCLLALLLVPALVIRCREVDPSPRPAHLVFVNGAVFARETAESVAVRGGNVVAVGSNEAIARYVGAETCVIDLDGRMLLPGFEDHHLHFEAGALSLDWPALGEAGTPEELNALLRVHEARLPPRAWLQGVGLRPSLTRTLESDHFERLFPHRPVSIVTWNGETLGMRRPAVPSTEPRGAIERAAAYVSRFGITALHTSPLFSPHEEGPLAAVARELALGDRLPFHLLDDESRTHESLHSNDARRIARAHPFKISPDWMPARRVGRSELPLRSLAREGYELHFGSDWPLAPLDPLAGIAAAVGRRDLDEKPERGLHPDEKLTVTQAVYGYTHRFVAPGAPSELAVVSQNLWKLPEEQLASVKVEMTIFAGHVVYLARSLAAEVDCDGLALE